MNFGTLTGQRVSILHLLTLDMSVNKCNILARQSNIRDEMMQIS